jgi:GT2 family glycosyltransferase
MAKPQLVVSDLSGYHNQHLPETVDRLTRGGSWKKQRVVIIMPCADLVPTKCVLSWWNLAFPPNNGVVKIMALGDEVGIAYSNAIEQVLAHPDLSQWEYILTIEHDNAPPADGVIKLIERMQDHPEFACIGGLYFTKGTAGVAQIWGDIKDPLINYRPQPPDANGGLVECYGTGMGFNLYRLGMFKDERIKRPWFRTLNGKDGQGIGTQDLSFATEARKAGYRFAIDCNVRVGHYDKEGSFGIPDMMY